MKKSQLILVAVGILAVVGLYALPKVVVDNDSTGAKMEESEGQTSTETPSVTEMHENELSSEKRTQADQLKYNYLNAPEKEEKVAAAQVLAGIYQEEGLFDSAAYYWSGAADLLPENMFLAEEAGKANYEAFSFALDKSKVELLAEKTRLYLNKVLDKDQSRLDLKTKVAMTYVSSSNPMQGITMLREVLEQDPQNEDGLFNMGVLSMQSGQYKRAVERFEELVKYHPDNLQGQFYLGVSYFEAKEKNKAKAQFELVKKMTEDPMILGSIQGYLDQL
ncbi:cytochrome c-type biogenesis protein CcmH/NrfG [Algoriphagus boseongensis]|uniref:Cytochrome c-type biogenesis protein CcmH/NrfG n=1 Tax=Algoriphagus boseongensis TaxID=1442587 RepID=A0A4R6T2E6_9BACT|nr:tetratricopeptide repeat protein [Algoriphagus boseongensis]TDQ12958.1 cytochrome c-type biogenesis protein CcmH/NrfG [Algoriphagus boseongensis]